MYAVVRSGGKQYRVSPGASFRVERMAGDVGSKVTLSDVLLVGDDNSVKVGAPRLAGASVTGTIVSQDRAAKVRTFKQKRRKGYRRTYGHRQDYTEIRVDQIQA